MELTWRPLLAKSKGRYSSSWEPHLRATGRHLLYGITQCYLPSDTSERAPPNPSHAGWYSIYLPRRDRKLSWPSWLDSAPAGRRTSDLSITSPVLPNRCTTKTTLLVYDSVNSMDFAGNQPAVYVFWHAVRRGPAANKRHDTTEIWRKRSVAAAVRRCRWSSWRLHRLHRRNSFINPANWSSPADLSTAETRSSNQTRALGITTWYLTFIDVYTVCQKVHPYDFHDNVKWKLIQLGSSWPNLQLNCMQQMWDLIVEHCYI